MVVHVRNDVKPSIGWVVTSHWLQYMDVSSISAVVASCVSFGCYKLFFDCSECLVYLYFFNECFLLVKKAVARTSKLIINGILLILAPH
jgi:hypothetical protein